MNDWLPFFNLLLVCAWVRVVRVLPSQLLCLPCSCSLQSAGVSTLTEIHLLVAQVVHGKIRANDTDDRDGVVREAPRQSPMCRLLLSCFLSLASVFSVCPHPRSVRPPLSRQMRTPLKSFLKRFVARQYGLKSLALQQLSALKASLLRYAVTSARCRVFGWLVGVFTDEMPTGMYGETSSTCTKLCASISDGSPA